MDVKKSSWLWKLRFSSGSKVTAGVARQPHEIVAALVHRGGPGEMKPGTTAKVPKAPPLAQRSERFSSQGLTFKNRSKSQPETKTPNRTSGARLVDSYALRSLGDL